MAQIKRTAAVGAMVLAALTACAPTGYDANQAGDTKPVAARAAEPSPSPSESASTGAAPRDVDLTVGLVAKKLPRMGKVVTDEKGWVLYRFDRDTASPSSSNCVDRCAQVWPPALTDGSPRLRGVGDDKVGTIDRPDGTRQLTVGGWPVYRYIGDKKPGQWKGQGVGDTWFVVAPDGKKNLTCLPTSPPKAAAPPQDSGSGESGESGGSSY